MRIALVTSMKFGLTQFTYRDIRALVDRGHDVALYTLLRRPGLYEPEPSWEVHTTSRTTATTALLRLAVRRPVTAARLLAHATRRRSLKDLVVACQFADEIHDPDLLLAYFGDHKLFVAYYVSRITGVPLTVTIRAYELYRNPNPGLFREALAACETVLTITEHNKRVLRERYGVPEERIRIVRQIVDLEKFAPRSPVTILTVGFFAEKKGHETLFRAVKMIDRDVEVWVVGDGTPTVLPVDVRALAGEIGVEDRVAFFGAQSGLPLRSLYRACDIFCLPSNIDSKGDHEGFPNVIAEAMAFAKPVVSTRHAGIPEAVEDEFLVDERDAEGLAAVLTRLIDDEALRTAVGARNRERASTLFSPKNTDLLEQDLLEAAGIAARPAEER